MSSGKLILGIIAGASIGAMAGILLAPDKGSATRKKIADRSNDLGNKLHDWAANLTGSTKNAGNAGQTETGQMNDLNTGTI